MNISGQMVVQPPIVTALLTLIAALRGLNTEVLQLLALLNALVTAFLTVR